MQKIRIPQCLARSSSSTSVTTLCPTPTGPRPSTTPCLTTPAIEAARTARRLLLRTPTWEPSCWQVFASGRLLSVLLGRSGAEWDDLAVPQNPIPNEPRNLTDSTLWHLVERTFLGRYEPLRMQAPCPDKVLTSLPIGEDERAEHAQGRTHTRRHSVRTRPSD